MGRLQAPSCFGEHSLDYIPRQDRKSLFADNRTGTPKTLRLASGKVIESPAKMAHESVMEESGAIAGGGQANHLKSHEAPPIWRDTIMTDPQIPSTVLLWMRRDHFVRVVGHLREVLQKNEMQRLIDSIPVFRDLKPNQRQRLAQAIDRRVVVTKMAGEIIYEQGVTNDFNLYLVHKGSVKISQVADDGSIIVLHDEMRAGSFFGEASFTREEPRNATATAIGKVDLIAISRRLVERVLGSMSVISESEASRRAYQERLAKADSFLWRDLTVISMLGTGTFGRVRLVHHEPTGMEYALKSMRKEKLIHIKQVEATINEKKLLAAVNHPFINQLVAVLCDDEPNGEVHLMVELCPGGELFTLLQQAGCFDLTTATFYAACVVSALVHLHARQIVYRDLKPENLVLDATGHVVIIDLGFAKMMAPGVKTYTLCGTPQYLAPEIVTSQGHSFPADRWAFGVLLFEMLVGEAPFDDKNTMGIYKKIMSNRLILPIKVRGKAKDLLSKLLVTNPHKRLGSGAGGSQELVEDEFFGAYDFELLEKKECVPPGPPPLRTTHLSPLPPHAPSTPRQSCCQSRSRPSAYLDAVHRALSPSSSPWLLLALALSSPRCLGCSRRLRLPGRYQAPWVPELTSRSDTRHFEVLDVPAEFTDPECWAVAREQPQYHNEQRRLHEEFTRLEGRVKGSMSAKDEKEMLNAKLKRAATKAATRKRGEAAAAKLKDSSASGKAVSLLDIVAVASAKRDAETAKPRASPAPSRDSTAAGQASVSRSRTPNGIASPPPEGKTRNARGSKEEHSAGEEPPEASSRSRTPHGRASFSSCIISHEVQDLEKVTSAIDPITGMACVSTPRLASTTDMQREARRSKVFIAPVPRRSKDQMKFERGELSTAAPSEPEQPLASPVDRKSPGRAMRPPRKSCGGGVLPQAGAHSDPLSFGTPPQPRASASLDSTGDEGSVALDKDKV